MHCVWSIQAGHLLDLLAWLHYSVTTMYWATYVNMPNAVTPFMCGRVPSLPAYAGG